MALIGVRRLCLIAFVVSSVVGCETLDHHEEPGGDPALPESSTPSEPLPVKRIEEELVIAAWAEPKQLPAGGGQAQLLVRVQRRGGARFPGVEVSLAASRGRLFSSGRILVTDSQGMTRDRLTTTKATIVTLNAGGTRYRFQVPVGEEAP